MWKIKLAYYVGLFIILFNGDFDGAIPSCIVFIICICIAKVHTNFLSIFYKFVGILHKLIMAYFLFPVSYNDYWECGCLSNIFITILYYLIYRYTKTKDIRNISLKVNYFLLPISSIIPIIIILVTECADIVSFIIFSISLLTAFCISLFMGGAFCETISKIKGKRSYFFISAYFIFLCSGISYLYNKYFEIEEKLIIVNLIFLFICFFIIIILNSILRNKMKYKSCSICKEVNPIDSKNCNRCGVSLDKPFPVCPNCGIHIVRLNIQKCYYCGFDWYSYFKKNITSSKSSVLYMNSSKARNEYKLNLVSGDFVTQHSKVLKSRYPFVGDIDIYGQECKISKKINPIEGLIYIFEDSSGVFGGTKYTWSVYSPAFYNKTHEDYEFKIKQAELEENLRKEQLEKERQLREEERIQKQKEQEEILKHQQEEAIQRKKEHAKKISEQTGIILD